ncbi:hypothetical protein [Vibrio sp. B183]|uniref:hypothetical protein n=1 Tax=Vibrio sp. B183 TaxID=1526762 RepID=UPI00068EEC11|nr:hypothetical protein [Vibrio sp. B183]
MHIHYVIEAMNVQTDPLSATLTQQWQSVLIGLEKQGLDELARARRAIHWVDYLTAEDLRNRLLIAQVPQVIHALSTSMTLLTWRRCINEEKRGMVYSRFTPALPDNIISRHQTKALRVVDGETRALSSPSLSRCLLSGDTITPLDGILFFQCKQLAFHMACFKQYAPQMHISTLPVMVSDTLTGTTRAMTSYQVTFNDETSSFSQR